MQHTGVNDIVGFPKDDYYYYKAAWINMTDEIVMHILPNTWNGDTGTDPIQVRVYTNCEYVELFINNKSVSNGNKQKVDPLGYYAVNVTYIPGEIKVNCVNSDNDILSTKKLETTDKASKIKLEWEYPYASNKTIYGDGLDVALISVYVTDDQDRIVPNANNTIQFSLDNESIAFILGVGNGNPACHERDKSSFRSVYHGKARILVQSKMVNANGLVKVTASSNGLITDTIEINIEKPINGILTI